MGNPLWPDGDWDDLRALWDLDPAVRHLNHGSYGAAPRPVLEEQARWIGRAQANPNRFFRRDLDLALAEVRERAARFLRVPPAELYLLANPTTAVAAVLRSAALGSGDSLLLTDGAYPGVAAAAAASGATVHTWRVGDRASWQAALERSGARLAIVEHVAYATGQVLPVAELAATARAAGALICVDGAHAAGALDLDVGRVGADFYAGSFHKWCCAPPGSGFLHARGEVRAPVPGAREAEGPPASIEWAGTHDFSPLLAVPRALDLLEEIGLERIRAYQRTLTDGAAALLGLDRPAGFHPGLLALPLGPLHEGDAIGLREECSAAGHEVAIAAAAGGWVLRLSAFLYNHPDDYSRLAAWLAQSGPAGGWVSGPGQVSGSR